MNKEKIKKKICELIDRNFSQDGDHINYEIVGSECVEGAYTYTPEPEYIPYTYEDDILGMKIIGKTTGIKYIILAQREEKVSLDTFSSNCSYSELFKNYTHLDGTPAGKLK